MRQRDLWSLPAKSALASRSRIVSTLTAIRECYQQGLLGGTVHELYPRSLSPSSRERYLYFTLAPALNYQRSSEQLWRAAEATFSDPDTRFVFDPKNVPLGLEQYRRALSRHSLAVQPERQSQIWYTISCALAELYRSDPRALLASAECDVVEIKRILAEQRRRFPYISGPKLLNYWLYMLDCFTDVKLRRRDAISVIPDTHVRRATAYLGLLPEGACDSPERVADAWYDLLEGTDIAPCDIHGPLWRWSRAGFPEPSALLARGVSR